METFFSVAEKVLLSILNFALFVVMSVIFLPSFLIVNYMQDAWSKKLSDIFGV